MSNSCLVLAVLALPLLACAASKEPAPAVAASAVPSAPAAAPAPAPTPAQLMSPVSAAAARGPLVFAAQPGWVSETPTSNMRKAQFRLPAAGGDSEDASLVVYWFGSEGGGGSEANIERWATQFEQPDGSDSHAALRSATRTVNGVEVVEVDLSGTYVAETSPGSGERLRKEGWRLLAAIIAAPEGAYYAKLVGPAATVASHAASYRAFVDGL